MPCDREGEGYVSSDDHTGILGPSATLRLVRMCGWGEVWQITSQLRYRLDGVDGRAINCVVVSMDFRSLEG